MHQNLMMGSHSSKQFPKGEQQKKTFNNLYKLIFLRIGEVRTLDTLFIVNSSLARSR